MIPPLRGPELFRKKGALLGALIVLLGLPVASVAEPDSGSVVAAIKAPDGSPVTVASCKLTGPGTPQTAKPDNNGLCSFSSLPSGIYTLDISASGYTLQSTTDITVSTGIATRIAVTLSRTALNETNVIGHVVTSALSGQLNTSPAAVSYVSAQDIENQLQPAVRNILQEIPGVSSALLDITAGSSYQFNVPSLRGGFYWETAQFIDGHPAASNPGGYFNSNNIDALFLDGIEVVKGPGAASPEVNNAMNGSINYRLKEPTAYTTGKIQQIVDSFGSLETDAEVSGPLGKHLQYVLGYSAGGSPGYFSHDTIQDWLGAGTQVNGQYVADSSYNSALTTTSAFSTDNPYAQQSS